jgi:hypothetical protein
LWLFRGEPVIFDMNMASTGSEHDGRVRAVLTCVRAVKNGVAFAFAAWLKFFAPLLFDCVADSDQL